MKKRKNYAWFNAKKILPEVGQECFVNVINTLEVNIQKDEVFVPARIMTGFVVNTFADLEKSYPIKLWMLNIVYKDFTNQDKYFTNWQLIKNQQKEPFIVTHWRPMNLVPPAIKKEDL